MGFSLSTLTSLLKFDTGKPTKDGIIGIDIGSSAIKIVQLRSENGTPALETYGELQLGPYESADLGRSTHLPAKKLIEALIDILRESGATSTQVSYSIPYNSSFIVPISVATIDQAQVGAMAPVEARKYIPIPLTKVTLSWFPLSVNAEARMTSILLSAINNDALSKYNLVVTGAGLTPVAHEIEIYSCIRSILAPEDENVAIIDCGALSTRMSIVRKGVITKTHSVLLSSVELTAGLQKAMGNKFSEAEEVKRTFGLFGKDDDPRIAKTLASGLERGIRELHTVFHRYEEEEKVEIGKVILTGGGALLPGIDAYIRDMFSKDVVLADPFSKVAYPAFLEDTLREAGPVFAVAIGIALQAFEKRG